MHRSRSVGFRSNFGASRRPSCPLATGQPNAVAQRGRVWRSTCARSLRQQVTASAVNRLCLEKFSSTSFSSTASLRDSRPDTPSTRRATEAFFDKRSRSQECLQKSRTHRHFQHLKPSTEFSGERRVSSQPSASALDKFLPRFLPRCKTPTLDPGTRYRSPCSGIYQHVLRRSTMLLCFSSPWSDRRTEGWLDVSFFLQLAIPRERSRRRVKFFPFASMGRTEHPEGRSSATEWVCAVVRSVRRPLSANQ